MRVKTTRVGQTMKLKLLCNLVVAGILLISPARGVHSQELGGVLKKVLTSVADGKCPSNLMSPLLVDVCEKQMPAMGKNLKQRGSIASVEFKGIQQTPSGPTDAYSVKFSGGTAMLWLISVGSDDKILILWSGSQ
jgi:hypothetical protein